MQRKQTSKQTTTIESNESNVTQIKNASNTKVIPTLLKRNHPTNHSPNNHNYTSQQRQTNQKHLKTQTKTAKPPTPKQTNNQPNHLTKTTSNT